MTVLIALIAIALWCGSGLAGGLYAVRADSRLCRDRDSYFVMGLCGALLGPVCGLVFVALSDHRAPKKVKAPKPPALPRATARRLR